MLSVSNSPHSAITRCPATDDSGGALLHLYGYDTAFRCACRRLPDRLKRGRSWIWRVRFLAVRRRLCVHAISAIERSAPSIHGLTIHYGLIARWVRSGGSV